VPFQEAAIPMLEPDKVLIEMKALQRHFKVRETVLPVLPTSNQLCTGEA
jgi:hypothetical protein